MIGFLIPLVVAVVAGYLATLAVYTALLLLITRLGRGLLMDGDCTSKLFAALHASAWLLAAFAGACLGCRLSPLAPQGTMVLTGLLGLFSAVVLAAGTRRMPGQMSAPAAASLYGMIAAGTVCGLYVRHIL